MRQVLLHSDLLCSAGETQPRPDAFLFTREVEDKAVKGNLFGFVEKTPRESKEADNGSRHRSREGNDRNEVVFLRQTWMLGLTQLDGNL